MIIIYHAVIGLKILVLQDFVWVMPYLPIGTQVSHLRPMANQVAVNMAEPQVRHLRTMHQPIQGNQHIGEAD